jgi:hypothetical protein
MNVKMRQAAAALLMVMMLLASVFGFTGMATASGEAQDAGPSSLTATNLNELLTRFAGDGELAIPARSERYTGTAEVTRYLQSAVPQGRTYTLVRTTRSESGYTALVEVADRGVRWAQITVSASVSGMELTRLEVTGVRLLLWPG